MSKKIWFSKPLAKEWDLYSKSYRHKKESVDEFFRRMTRQSPFESWQNAQLKNYIWSLWHSDATKELLHIYFADKNLKDFLENTSLTDLDGIIKYIDENGFMSEQGILKLKYIPFGIHIPYENKYKAFAFGLMNNQLNQMVLTWAVANSGGWFSNYNYNELKSDESADIKESLKIFRFAINTIAYMEAFPECVKEGAPNIVKESYSEKSLTLGVSEKILEPINEMKTGKIISPHFRKGYFKRFASDFYKNKQGQIGFVSPTMVNGRAKTVEKSKDKTKLQEFKNK